MNWTVAPTVDQIMVTVTRQKHHGPRTATAIALALALLLAACTSGSDTAGSAVTADATTTTDSPPTEPPTTAPNGEATAALSGLDGAIGEATDLVLSWLNGAVFDEATYELVFDDAFRAAVSFDQMPQLFDQLRLAGPFEVGQIQRSTSIGAELIVLGASGERAVLTVAVASADDSTMTGLFIAPATQPSFDAPASIDEAVARLEALGTTRIGALDSSCASIDDGPNLGAREQAPIGSGFKLWVLAAVVATVESGNISWDGQIEVRDELDSIPSGVTQNDPDGTLLTVRQLAERMIEISDNTATDHLMDLVGREAVESAMINSGHSAPERNLPLMNTREFTILKFSDPDLLSRYLAADVDERRRILDDQVGALPLPPLSNITSVTDPVEVETVEWFASPVDLCRTLTSLADVDEAAAILARNAGIPDEAGRWSTILYKGGSEPGVLAMAWLVEADDGTRQVVAGSVFNEDRLIDEFEATNLLAYLRDAVG